MKLRLFRYVAIGVATLSIFVIAAAILHPGTAFVPSAEAQESAQPQTSPASAANSSASTSSYQSGTEQPETVLRTNTRLVMVNVVAVDGRDRPITDFTKDDFKLLEDGKEQRISVFSFQHPRPGPPVAQVLPKLPPNMVTNFPHYREDRALNVVLLDGLNSKLDNQTFAQHEVGKFLQKLSAEQPLAVYGLFADLQLLQDFGDDPTILMEKIKHLKGHASLLLENPVSGGPDQGLPEARPGQNANLASNSAERTRYLLRARTEKTQAALIAISQALSAYPGRKNLIWLSEGFPMTLSPQMDLGLDSDSGADLSAENYSHNVAKAADALMENQIALYPIDVRGLANYDFGGASMDGERGGLTGSNAGAGFGAAHRSASRELSGNHATLDTLAERTGGKAFYNRNDLDNLMRKSIDDGSTFYSLGYYPYNKNWDNKFRKIEVKVNRSGAHLRYRLGYFAVDPRVEAKALSGIDPNLDAQQIHVQTFVQALSLDVPAATGLIFKAAVFPPSAQTKNKVLVTFAVDASTIHFEKYADGKQHAKVDCAVQAYSANRTPVKTESATFDVGLGEESYKKAVDTGFQCQRALELPNGDYILRLGVLDDNTGFMGTTNTKLTVASASLPETKTAGTKTDEKK